MSDSRYNYYINSFIPVFRRALKVQLSPLVAEVKMAGSTNELLSINVHLDDKPVEDAIMLAYTKIGSYYMNNTIKAIRGSKKSLSDEDKLYMARMRDYVVQNCGKKIKWITGTTDKRFREIVRREVTLGLEEGKAIDKIAASISSSLNFENGYRSIRIARTETLGASNAGSLNGAMQTGLSLEKGWMTARRENVRNSHKKMNGVFVDLNAMFSVPIFDGEVFTGDNENMQHPGDTNGSGSNIINCRCTLVYRRKLSSYQQNLTFDL